MNVNRRTWTLLIVAVAVIGGVYAITVWQRARETERLMTELRSPDHAVAAQAMVSLRERVDSVHDQLVEIAQTDGAPARWRAIELLAHAGSAESRDVLMNALQAPDPVVRAAASRALADRGVRGAADRIAMLATADEEPMPVRLAAVRALQALRTPTHLAELSRLATNRPPAPPEEEPAEVVEEAAEEPAEVVEEAAEAAEPAEVVKEPAEEPAEEWSDETVDLRIEAVRAVAIMGGRAEAAETGESPAMKAADVLVEACSPQEHDAGVRQAACYAMADLAQLKLTPEIRTRAVETFLAAIDDEIGDVRIAAIHGLKVVSAPEELRDEVLRALEDALNDDHYWVRVAAGEEPIGG